MLTNQTTSLFVSEDVTDDRSDTKGSRLMFKILKSELYDIFQCTTKECPANCCDEDWVIIIDEDAYQRIRALGSPDIDCKINIAMVMSAVLSVNQ